MAGLYVLDTNSFRVFGNYYPESFPSFWDKIAELVTDSRLLSCREVRKELEMQSPTPHLNSWVDEHPEIFTAPTGDEMEFVAEIFRVAHFHQLIGQKQRLKGLPVADPFLIARGATLPGCIITEESFKPHAAQIPNVCEHFGVRCMNVEGFLGEVGWRF
ncbi:MAG: PIN domain-containing protein [Thermoleophilia bacterium]